jgi:iron complex transport system substrate-binding protein
MKRFFKLLPALALMAILAACGPPRGTSAPDTDAVTVTDQGGRLVTIPGDVKRLVSGYYISSSACLALGLKDRFVGIEAYADTRPLYRLAAPELPGLPVVGTSMEFDLEGCLALEPDLVIIPLRLKDRAPPLEAAGIPVLLVNPESQNSLKEMVTLIGKACKSEKRAEALNAYFDAELAGVGKLVSGTTAAAVVYMAGTGSHLMAAPRDMYQASLIRMAGGKNATDGIAGDFWTAVSYEQLLAMDPEVIVIPSYAAYSPSDVLADRALSQVSAVRNRKVYQMPAGPEGWDTPGPSCVLGVKWLLATLHGDVYGMDDLRRDAAAFYREFFGIENIDAAFTTGKHSD